MRANITLSVVQQRRKKICFEGVHKIHKSISPTLKSYGLKLGRDKLNAILRNNNMLVVRRKKYVKTTDSDHAFYRYKNHILGVQPSHINQIWVADITYISTHSGFMYLALITDAFSRKIVGYDISDSLELLGAKRALKMAIKQKRNLCTTTHHSDHGVQYCSKSYTKYLKKNKATISMGEIGNCYENAMAERVNGILKEEFNLDINFKSKKQAVKACKQAINLYNNDRLHMALDYKTPSRVYNNVA